MSGLPPYARLLGLRQERHGDSIRFVMPFDDDVTGRPGYLHGGAIAGLLEFAAFITLADAGRALCKGQGEVRLGRFAVTKRGRMATPRSVASAQSGLDAGAASLFERLRELRRALAGRQGVPPYLVFSDATLRGIAAVAPSSLEALRAVKGVGDTKLARYGAPVLAVVAGREPMEVIETGS